jgi:hypothetical protein
LLATLGSVGLSTYACVAAAAMLLAGAIGVNGSTAARLPTPREAMAFDYLAVVVTALAFVLWYSGVHRLRVERAGLFAGLMPVAALVTSAAVGAAVLTLPRLAGAVAVGAGVALGMTRRHEQAGPEPRSRMSRASVAGQVQQQGSTGTASGERSDDGHRRVDDSRALPGNRGPLLIVAQVPACSASSRAGQPATGHAVSATRQDAR